MKKIIIAIIVFFYLSNLTISKEVSLFSKDSSNSFVSGFSKIIHGNSIDYKTFYPEANSAILVRCTNDNDFIEWETDTISSKSEFITFVWIVSYSTGTCDGNHQFSLFVNDNDKFNFTVGLDSKESDWVIRNNNLELSFKYIKRDNHGDHTGYMFLKVPFQKISNLNTLKLKVVGDNSGSRAGWFMVFKNKLETNVAVTPEYAIIKNKNNKKLQRVKILTHYFDKDGDMKVWVNGEQKDILKLTFGLNEYILPLEYEEAKNEFEIKVSINDRIFSKKVKLNNVRPFEVYIIPHSHVDIGYTSLQTEVEKTQIRNIEKAIELIEKTKNYPLYSRFKWNPEVLWPVKCFLEKSSIQMKEKFIKYVKEGFIGLDGLFSNELTGLCKPEELIRSFYYSNILEKEFGIKIETAMISDIPGYTWGIVNAAAQNGIKYFSSGPNHFDRIGYTLSEWGDKPFYWLSQSGKEKLLVWVAGKGYAWFHGWKLSDGDPSPLLKYLEDLANSNYEYDMVQLRYTIGGDNGYPDPKLSDFVKEWNEKYESPKLRLATTFEMFKEFEEKYKNKIPSFSGDFTPYWEDGAGSTAKETAINRENSDKLVQLEILYTLLKKEFPHSEFYKAWENILLFTEHTWGAHNSISDPESDFVKGQWELKKAYCENADTICKQLFNNLYSIDFETEMISEFKVYNTSSWVRTDVVRIPYNWKTEGEIVKDENNNIVPSQKLSSGEIVFIAKDIPPLSSKKYYITNGVIKKENKFELKDNTIQNNKYKISFDYKTGAITDLIRKEDNFNFVDKRYSYLLNEYIYTGFNATNPQTSKNQKIEIKEEGDVLTSIVVYSDAPGCNKLSQEIVLFNDLDRIDIINFIDKKKIYDKENVRFSFPFNINSQTIRMELPWSVISPEKDQLPGANKNFFTIQRWIDVSNDQNGITLATIDVPFIEIGEMTAEAYMVTPHAFGAEQKWMKTAKNSPLIFSWAMNNSWHTNYKATQEGLFKARYSLKTHKKFDYLSAYKFGVENSQPLIVLPIDNEENEINKIVFDENIVVTSIKPSKDNKYLMIRLFNPSDKEITTHFIGKNKFSECYISREDESIIEKITNDIILKPFDVITLKVIK